MAQTRKTTTKKKTSQTKKTAPKKKAQSSSDVTFSDWWHWFSSTKIFFPIMTILVIAVMVGIDLLVSWNNFTRFFMILGIEIIVAVIIWVCAMFFSLSAEKKKSNDN